MATVLNRNPETLDLLQSTKFRLTFGRLPGLTYFCQSANFPGVSLTEIPRYTPFVDLYHAGEKLVYDTFNITFLVDEELRSWTEIHDWMRGLTFPTDFKEYINLTRTTGASNIKNFKSDSKAQYSDAVLTLYTNKNNPNFRIKLYDVFPTSLSSILVNTSDSAENIVIADAIFRFSYYDYERI
jgi:hypothetical protein